MFTTKERTAPIKMKTRDEFRSRAAQVRKEWDDATKKRRAAIAQLMQLRLLESLLPSAA